MKNRSINKNERKIYFDLLQRLVQGQEVEIEVASLDVGDQIEKDWSLLQGITYDAKQDLIFVATEDFEHTIAKPEDIISVQDDRSINAVYVKDSDGHVQSIKFRQLLMLEAPDRHTHL